MKKQRLAFLFILLLGLGSCAHQSSGRYVLQNGKWTFKKSNIGFSRLGNDESHRIDNNSYTDTEGLFVWPVPASKKVSSYFGLRKGKHHDGIDIPAVTGTNIIASRDGEVSFSGRMRGYGRVIIIKHPDNYHTVYAHNNRNYVSKGQKVSRGEVIGKVGSSGRSSGPHLHFEIRRNNRVRNPARYLARLQRYLKN